MARGVWRGFWNKHQPACLNHHRRRRFLFANLCSSESNLHLYAQCHGYRVLQQFSNVVSEPDEYGHGHGSRGIHSVNARHGDYYCDVDPRHL